QPLELAKVEFPAPLSIGVAGTAILTMKNNTSQSLPAVQLPFAIAGEGLTTTTTLIDVPVLGDGETSTVTVDVTADEYASRSIPVAFQATTTGIAGSTPQTLVRNEGVPVSRVGQLEICVPSCGSVATLPLRVRA